MSSFTRRRGGAGASLRGLFVEGVWHCDCTPRQPANHFEVKKPGPNQGKWCKFQDAMCTCQKQQDDKSRCKFFLWDSDAHPREATALARNSRTEPPIAGPKAPKRCITPPLYTFGRDSGEPSRKRDRTASVGLTDEYGFEASQDFGNELDHVMAAVETPRKAVRTTEVTTPSTKRVLPWSKENQEAINLSGLQTPQTSHTTPADPSPSGLRKSLLAPSRPLGSVSPDETPTPNRFKDSGKDELVQDVLALLRDAGIRFGAMLENDLKVLVSKRTKTAEGLRRGRDVARSTIKARDAKITELGYRISTLEAELEAERALVKHLQWEVEAEDHADP
ncbi:hypothetical protein SVAN01_07131 [Stagonosporopsis vannaccii]|nr:hypothetical protein SVAN01_07131 [Stagonosporopsis vannaccii]